jgi:hypothetical protein
MADHELFLQQPKGRELLGGDLLAQCLKALGVEVAFGLHGGHLDAFLMGCVDVGIELVDTRQVFLFPVQPRTLTVPDMRL